MKHNFVWQLPVKQSNITDHDWIHPKAKYHCFVQNQSLCNKYVQDTDYFETDIERGEIIMRPEIACKICRAKWIKQFNELS
jgi:hypothetical protein